MVYERYIRDYLHEFDQLDRRCWNYEDGCVLIGAQAMYEASGNEFCYQSIKKYIDRYVCEDGSIKYYDMAEYNLDKIPSGRVLYLLYEKTGEVKYKIAIERLMEQLRGQPRTKCGSFWHKKIYPYQIWLDGLYMGMPFYTLYEMQFGDRENLEDVIQQFENARSYLYDEKSGLYYHAYDERRRMFWADKKTGLSENFWSRAIGWYLMALIDCFEVMGMEKRSGEELGERMTELQKGAELTKKRGRLAELFCEAVEGLFQYQDRETGLFYQLTALIKEPGNYLETSASAMFAYAVLKACRLGVLEEARYRPRGEEILIALETRMFRCRSGRLKLTGMCVGAGLGPEGNDRRDGSVFYYLNERIVKDEQKGAGVVMMAYSEWLKLKREKGLAPLLYPRVTIYNDGY